MRNRKKGLSQLYHEHPMLISAIIGGLLGYFVISPAAMFVEHTTHTELETLDEHIFDLLLLKNIPWSALFTLLGIITGLIFGYLQWRIHKLETELFQAEKLASVGELAAGVAHEINTPLSNISIISDNIKLKVKDKDEFLEENLDEISSQVERASGIVTDLLDFSKTSEVEFEDLNVNDVVLHTLSFISGKRNENVEIIEKYNEGIPQVRGEPNQLQQVFLNMINNAFDAMPDGGRLEITTGVHDDEYVEIKFKDSGFGIPKENMNKIFDPFFTTKETGKGTGLGLSICHGIIQNHKGRIEVDSKINVGTIFTVILPRSPR
jgi:two-component system NtrC family sensor kinase